MRYDERGPTVSAEAKKPAIEILARFTYPMLAT
jgi:hypothetical protein